MKLLVVICLVISINAYSDIEYKIDDEEIGNIITAKIENKEVHLTTRSEMNCYFLNKVQDFNNDGYKDALVSHRIACGGNASPNDFFFITYDKDAGFKRTKVFATSWEEPSFKRIDGKNIISLKPFVLNRELNKIEAKNFYLTKNNDVSTIDINQKNGKKNIPKFKDFSVTQKYKGENKKLVLNKFGKLFRTRLNRATANNKPEFAGKYLVTSWGCGTGACRTGAIIDASTGEAFQFPVATTDVWPLKPGSLEEDRQELIYKIDSRLMIFAGDVEVNAKEFYADSVLFYEFTGSEFELLKILPYGKSSKPSNINRKKKTVASNSSRLSPYQAYMALYEKGDLKETDYFSRWIVLPENAKLLISRIHSGKEIDALIKSESGKHAFSGVIKNKKFQLHAYSPDGDAKYISYEAEVITCHEGICPKRLTYKVSMETDDSFYPDGSQEKFVFLERIDGELYSDPFLSFPASSEIKSLLSAKNNKNDWHGRFSFSLKGIQHMGESHDFAQTVSIGKSSCVINITVDSEKFEPEDCSIKSSTKNEIHIKTSDNKDYKLDKDSDGNFRISGTAIYMINPPTESYPLNLE